MAEDPWCLKENILWLGEKKTIVLKIKLTKNMLDCFENNLRVSIHDWYYPNVKSKIISINKVLKLCITKLYPAFSQLWSVTGHNKKFKETI